MSEVDVLLEHVLGEVLLITGYTRPRFSNCGDEERGNKVILAVSTILAKSKKKNFGFPENLSL